MPNRGRFQAQGNKLEKSENWAQKTPLYFCESEVLIQNLKGQLSKTDLKNRERAFKDCENFIIKANENGGIEGCLIKSFPKNYKERVDLEVRQGLAFNTKPIL